MFKVALYLFFTVLIQSAYAEEESSQGNESWSSLEEETRWDKSTRLIGETLLQFDDLKEIVKYPYEHQEETWYFLAGIGGLILMDKKITALYQDKVETRFEGRKLRFPKWAEFWPDRAAEGYITLGAPARIYWALQ